VFASSPTLVTPNIGAATGTSLITTGNITAGNYPGLYVDSFLLGGM
jgi:hypothetical protein